MDTSFPPDSWTARLVIVLVAALAWWRVATWIGVPTYDAVLLAAAAAILMAGWMARSRLG